MTAFIKIGEFIVKNGAEIAGGIALAVGGYIAGRNQDKITAKLKGKPKRKAKKRSNTKKASGNRKAGAKKVVKKVAKKTTKTRAVGEKTPAVTSQVGFGVIRPLFLA